MGAANVVAHFCEQYQTRNSKNNEFLMNSSYLTAMARTNPSIPAKHVHEHVIVPRKFNSVLDWGCGKGRDVIFFKESGLRVMGYDPYYATVKPKLSPKYDCVMITYVLNTIETLDLRLRCLREARSYLRRDGRMMISVSSRSEIDKEAEKANWTASGDGWLTGKNTFQHGLDIAELVDLTKKAGLTPITCAKLSNGLMLAASK